MCTERYINPFTDFGFKRMFGTAANKGFLISFLNSLFNEKDKITDISYRNVEQFGPTPDDRAAAFDLYCTTESGAHIIVEMQNCYQRYFMDRSIYYSSFPMQEVAKKGDWDYRLPKIYTVAFLNFRMGEYADVPTYKHVVKLTDTDTGKVFFDKLTYIYIELPKFEKEREQLESTSDIWMYIIKNINRLDEYPEWLNDEMFRRFFRVAEIAAFSLEERQAYESSLKNMRDYNNTINTAREDALAKGRAEGEAKGLAKGLKEGKAEGLAVGRAEGLAAGRAEERRLLAKKLKGMGMDIATISELSDLDPDEIRNL